MEVVAEASGLEHTAGPLAYKMKNLGGIKNYSYFGDTVFLNIKPYFRSYKSWGQRGFWCTMYEEESFISSKNVHTTHKCMGHTYV